MKLNNLTMSHVKLGDQKTPEVKYIFGTDYGVVYADKNKNVFGMTTFENYRDFSNLIYSTVGEGRFVSLGYEQGGYSTDGFSWNFGTNSAQIYGLGKYNSTRLIGTGNNVAVYSDDGGLSWNSATLQPSSGILYFAGSNGTTATAIGNTAYRTTSNGTIWNGGSISGFSHTGNGIYDGTRFVVPGVTTPGALPSVKYSSNGSSWVVANVLPTSGRFARRISYGNGVYLVVVDGGGINTSIYRSTNLSTWVLAYTMSSNDVVLALHHDGTGFLFVDNQSSDVIYSTDGITFSKVSNVPTQNIVRSITHKP